MKIAVTYENGLVFQHFGHSEKFKIFEINNNNEIEYSEVIDTNGSGHGQLAAFLKNNNIDILICGGIGSGAIDAINMQGIKIYGGVSGEVDIKVSEFLKGNLNYNPNVKCSHHDENGHDSCSSHNSCSTPHLTRK